MATSASEGRDASWWWRAALVVLLAGGTAAYAGWLGGRDEAFWRLPGASLERLRAADVPSNWRVLIGRDFGLIGAILVTLGVGIAVSAPGWPPWTVRTWRGRHLWVAALACVGYAVSDAGENLLLWRAADDLTDVTPDEARHLAWAMASKWGFLAAAVLLVVALWQRQVPGSGGFRPSWGGPNVDLPDDPPPSWSPDPKRFGISVSGGGIRSASFALGALQALRQRGLLQRARYVTSVSGGSYTTSAYAAVNQPWYRDGGPSAGGVADGFAPNSPEEHALRRSLRYLATDRKVLLGAIARIVLGMLINLIVLYLLLFAFARPIGWLIGTPLVQEGLRVDEPLALSVAGTSDDPDITAADPQPYQDHCPTLVRPPDDTEIRAIGDAFEITGEPDTVAREVRLRVPPQCVLLVDPPSTRRTGTPVSLEEERPAVVAIVDGTAVIQRQPTYRVRDGARRTQLKVVQPVLKVASDAGGLPDDADLAGIVEIDRAASVEPASILDLRGPLDIDARHGLLPLALFGVALLTLVWRTVGRPDYWKVLNVVTTITGALALVLTLVMFVLPWLVDVLPRAINRAATTAPSEGAFGNVDLPVPVTLLPSILAWPLLSIAAVTRFLGARKKTPAATTPRARNARAFSKKYFKILRQLLVGLLLVAVAVVTTVNILAVGAMSGPGAQLPWLSREVFHHDLVRLFPPDALFWFLIVLALVVTRGVGESTSWSPAPIYKRRLAWAFAWARSQDGVARRRSYGPGDRWADFESRDPAVATDAYAGYVDGKSGDGSELVLCCAANVVGEDRAPTGRRAVSFTASRSVIGGAEIGWMRTREYLARMGRRRKWDINLPGITAISGAAVSPAMGKASVGPVGTVLAVLNVRLGAWLPHPEWVRAMTNGTWTHNPGWPWYCREVARRYRAESPYLYVTDGGHWENLGLVEALRRGCTTIVAISAAGDGELSHATVAEAIEIARSDLGVDIELDEIWQLRPIHGGEPESTLESGRQYILEPGPQAELGRAAPRAFAFGSFTYPSGVKGKLLLLEASMIDGLPVDVHAYAEGHPEFPNTSTGDQLFTDRDFESYRVLGHVVVQQAFDTESGAQLQFRIEHCTRIP